MKKTILAVSSVVLSSGLLFATDASQIETCTKSANDLDKLFLALNENVAKYSELHFGSINAYLDALRAGGRGGEQLQVQCNESQKKLVKLCGLFHVLRAAVIQLNNIKSFNGALWVRKKCLIDCHNEILKKLIQLAESIISWRPVFGLDNGQTSAIHLGLLFALKHPVPLFTLS